MTFHIILALAAFMLSLLGSRLAIMAWRKRPQPVNIATLKSGQFPPLRSGGIVLIFTLIICMLAADVRYVILVPILLLTAISLLSDLIKIPFPIRLLVEIMAVIVPLSMMQVTPFNGLFPLWIDKILTGILWISFIHIFRDMDRMDGLCAIEMASIGSGLCLLMVFAGFFPNMLSTYGLIIATAGCGFLWWNWPRAKILMGDVGSVPIGFLLGYLLLIASTSGYGYAALLLPAYYISDALISWAVHSTRGKRTEPVIYYYQRMEMGGRNTGQVARYILGINILLVFLALRTVTDPEIAVFHVALAYAISCTLIYWFARKGHENP